MTKALFILLAISCTSFSETNIPIVPKEFSRGEIILATQLLTKIFDREMAPLSCVPDMDEASLLLRTIHPRIELARDDLEALLDDEEQIRQLVQNCDQNCTCDYLDDLFREHQVTLNRELRLLIDRKRKLKSLGACLNYARETFCSSELFRELNKEKKDFSFD